MMSPEYISLDELNGLIADQVGIFSSNERDWWELHRVSPIVASDGKHSRFVIAIGDDNAIYFDDHEDEFGVGILTEGRIENCSLLGTLVDAVRSFALRNRHSQMDRVIEISRWRPKHIDAKIVSHSLNAGLHDGYIAIGVIRIHLVADGERFQTQTLGPILRDLNGRLWVQFPDSPQNSVDSRLAFLASDMARLASIADLNLTLVQSTFVPCSR